MQRGVCPEEVERVVETFDKLSWTGDLGGLPERPLMSSIAGILGE